MRRAPRLFFSFRSPYSRFLVAGLLREVPDAHTSVEWVPYWEPDERTQQGLEGHGASIHYADMSKAKHLYILQDTKRLSARHGLSMTWPVDRDPWWVLPHHAWMAARRIGRGKDLYWALINSTEFQLHNKAIQEKLATMLPVKPPAP